MTIDQLHTQITKGVFLPVYLLYGEEEFFIESNSRRIARTALGDGDPAFNYFVFNEGDESEDRKTDRKTALAYNIVNAADGFPFMSDRKVVLSRLSDAAASVEPLASYLRNPNPSTVLILVMPTDKPVTKKKPASNKSKSSFSALQFLTSDISPGAAIEFGKMPPADIAGWVCAELEKNGKTIDMETALLLVDLKESSTRDIAGELEKIQIALPNVLEVTQEHILDLCGVSKTYNVFQFTDAVIERNAQKAMEIAFNILGSTDPVAMVAALHRHISLLWSLFNRPVRSNVTFAEAVSLGFGSPRHYLSMARSVKRFTHPSQFQAFFETLIEADLAAKSGADKATTVSIMVNKLCSR
jgi:DNA polymerase-3 subunit delta